MSFTTLASITAAGLKTLIQNSQIDGTIPELQAELHALAKQLPATQRGQLQHRLAQAISEIEKERAAPARIVPTARYTNGSASDAEVPSRAAKDRAALAFTQSKPTRPEFGGGCLRSAKVADMDRRLAALLGESV